MKSYKILVFVLFLAISACKKGNEPAPKVQPTPTKTSYVSDKSFKIVAYFPSYQNPDSVDVNKYKMITHLFYAFLTPTASGSLNALPQTARFNQVVNAARSKGVKVGISISGANDVFVALAANVGSRTNLVKNVLSFVKANNLDGVDLDWEYPRTTDGSDATYALLVKELSDTLHNNNT